MRGERPVVLPHLACLVSTSMCLFTAQEKGGTGNTPVPKLGKVRGKERVRLASASFWSGFSYTAIAASHHRASGKVELDSGIRCRGPAQG